MRALTCCIVWVVGFTGMKGGCVMFQAIFSPVAATLNAWLVIDEVGRGELVERMAGTVSFLVVC